MGDRLARVLGGAGQLEGLGAAEKLLACESRKCFSRAYRWKLVLFLMARFLFAYDCHLVNCVRHTRSTARQRYISDTTQEDQGRLTPLRAALAAALACFPVLVAAANIVSDERKLRGTDRGASAKFLCKGHAAGVQPLLRNVYVCVLVSRSRGCDVGVHVLLDAGLGPILAVLVVLEVSVESRNSFLRRMACRVRWLG